MPEAKYYRQRAADCEAAAQNSAPHLALELRLAAEQWRRKADEIEQARSDEGHADPSGLNTQNEES